MRVLLLLTLALPLVAAEPPVFPLYPGAAPGSESWNWPETSVTGPKDTILRIGNVSRPTLTVFLPDPARANGTGIVICPGGGFRILAFNHEGTEVAEWLNSLGVAAFVLKYRVMRTSDESSQSKETMVARRNQAMEMGVADALAAMRLVRSRANQWRVDPSRIGIMGFSAGGYVTAHVAFTTDPQARPAFAAPIYAYFPDEMKAPAGAPPLFLTLADDDRTVPPVRNSIRLYTIWKDAGLTAEMHIYQRGGHGFGMRKKDLPVDGWTDRLREWLSAQGMLTTARR